MYGQLGHNSTSNEYLPRKVPDLMGSEATQIACGRCHMLVYLSNNNRLYSFGLGANGQLGLDNAASQSNPTLVKLDLINVRNGIRDNKNIKPYKLYSINAGGDQSFIQITHVSFKFRFHL
jgi:alpha-tubulin suppressor-like RCC1 family protein